VTPTFIVAPTERHKAIKGLVGEEGEVSLLPERMGCDIAWRAQGQWWGVQRKEIADFIASVQDGRLAKEIAQMRNLPMRVVIIEGRIQWSTDGKLIIKKRFTNISKRQFLGMQFSLSSQDVSVIWTESAYETAEVTMALADWSEKDRHGSLMRRPGPQTSWGSVTDEDWSLHLLQSFDGLGLEKARALKKHFGGVPMSWDCTEDELKQVPGIGKVLAARLIGAMK
jgi:ERCC4-type nuclease